jgi:hypothetical protein
MFWSTKQSNVTTTSSSSTTYIPTTINVPSSSSYTIVGGGGGGGTLPSINSSSNAVLTSSGWVSQFGPNTSNNTVSISGTISIDSEEPIIKTKKNKINLDEVYENILILNEMFSVIVPNKKKIEENPTLKDAYEQYNNAKLIEPKYNSEEYRTAYEQYKLLETLVKEEHDNS